MNSSQNMEKTLEIIKDIEKKTLDLKNKDKISKIEMDILLERVRMLYDNLIQVDQNYEYEKNLYTEAKTPHTPEFEKKKEPAKESTSETKQEQVKEQPLVEKEKKIDYQEEKKVNKKEEELHKNQPEQKPEEKEKAKSREYGPEIVADKYHNTVTFRHENLSKNQTKKDVSSKMQTKPIQDLVKAIGVNDKFLFIRELFDGDKESYHEAIQILNEIPNYQEAETYIKERFNWDWEKPEVKKFLDLIQRKFS